MKPFPTWVNLALGVACLILGVVLCVLAEPILGVLVGAAGAYNVAIWKEWNR